MFTNIGSDHRMAEQHQPGRRSRKEKMYDQEATKSRYHTRITTTHIGSKKVKFQFDPTKRIKSS